MHQLNAHLYYNKLALIANDIISLYKYLVILKIIYNRAKTRNVPSYV